MTKTLITLSSLAAALVLAGCASQQPASTSTAPAAKPVAAAPAMSDAEMANALKGNWEGKWELPGFGGGKYELFVTEVAGTSLKGNGNWYGTANGDLKLPLTTATVAGGELKATQPNTEIKLKMKSATELTGTWSAAGYSGPLTLTRK